VLIDPLEVISHTFGFGLKACQLRRLANSREISSLLLR
ncbi:hypothetical protein A2U01_0114469, partial [Trifolium medium]|nr:hypothetical protein [Trifolium medium]